MRGGLVQADYTCPQNYAAYTAADHDTYHRLYQRQSALVPGLACDEFIVRCPYWERKSGFRVLRKSTNGCTRPPAGKSLPCQG